MTPHEAKKLLSCTRPEGQDTDDPQFAEAFAMLDSDATLRAWYEAEQAFDTAFAKALAAAPSPAGLKDKILASVETVEAPQKDDEPVVGFPARKSDTGRRWLAIAATVIIVAGLALVMRQPAEPTPEQLAAAPQMVAFLDDFYTEHFPGFDRASNNYQEIQTYLASVEAPVTQVLPASLQQGEPMGCLVIQYGDARIGMICFRKGGGEIYHLFTADRQALGAKVPESGTYQLGEHFYTVWNEDTQTHVVSGKKDPTGLVDLL